MKKVFALVAIAGLFATTSCKKNWSCSGTGNPTLDGVEYPEENYTQDQLDALKATCEFAGGTWSSN